MFSGGAAVRTILTVGRPVFPWAEGVRLTSLGPQADISSLPHSSGSYLDSEGLRHQDDFDVSLLVCHCAVPFEEQGEAERHVLRSADPLS